MGLAAVAAAVVIGLQLGAQLLVLPLLGVVLPVPRSRALRALSRPRPGASGAPALALIAVWLVATRHGPFSDASVSDLYVYGSYKDLMAHGLVPYRDFDFEYPPGALLPIRLAGCDDVSLSLLMLGCALVTQLAAWAAGGPLAGWAMVALPVLAARWCARTSTSSRRRWRWPAWR